MPWVASTFRKHNRRAVGPAGKKAASIANAVLRKTGDEGRAIRIASAAIKRKRGGKS